MNWCCIAQWLVWVQSLEWTLTSFPLSWCIMVGVTERTRPQLHLLQWFWECIRPDSMCTTYRLYCLQLEPEYVICIYISPQHSISKFVSFPGSPQHRRGSLGINEANCKLMIKFMCKPFLQLQCCCKQQQKSYINKTKVPYWILQYHTSRGTV